MQKIWLRTRYSKLRSWCKRNKDVTKTIGSVFVAILLSVMAIIVSIGALQISYYQTQLTEMQNQPIFSFVVNISPPPHLMEGHFIDDNTDWTDDTLLISKKGSPMTEFDAKYYVFEKGVYKNSSFSKEFMIPINYYANIEVETDSEGEFIKAVFPSRLWPDSPNGNLKEVRSVMGGFFDYAKEKGDSIEFELMRYVEIKYKDIFNKQHDDFYLVTEHGTTRLSSDEGERIKKFDADKKYYLANHPFLVGQRWEKSYYDEWYSAIMK